MDAILSKAPEQMPDEAISTWKRLGVLTDSKIRNMSTKYGALPVKVDGTVMVKRWEDNGKIYESWVKKDSDN